MIRETLFAHVCGYGVPNALELHDGTGALIAFNNNWAADDDHRWHYHRQPSPRYPSSGYAPSDARECAIIADLPPGNYTPDRARLEQYYGIALVEAYDLDQ
jgi:hypothetical protein